MRDFGGLRTGSSMGKESDSRRSLHDDGMINNSCHRSNGRMGGDYPDATVICSGRRSCCGLSKILQFYKGPFALFVPVSAWPRIDTVELSFLKMYSFRSLQSVPRSFFVQLLSIREVSPSPCHRLHFRDVLAILCERHLQGV